MIKIKNIQIKTKLIIFLYTFYLTYNSQTLVWLLVEYSGISTKFI